MTCAPNGQPLKATTGLLVHSLLYVPILLKDRMLGVLAVDNRISGRVFTDTDETLLTSLADYAAVAIENAGLYEQAQSEIVERMRVEEQIEASLKEKEVLLKEIHHRVKNNLQTITSLLNIHMRSVTSDQAHQALEEVQTRVRALALVHHYLYESDDVRVVELRLFVGELCQVLHDTLSGAGRPIRIETDVHNITIASERAVPIALLITEAVTNAYKHAFPDGRAGKISVAIRRLDETSALLTIGADGVGYSAVEDLPETVVAGRGVGMSLISAFARQLGEDLEVSGPPGTTISLRLRLKAKPEAEGSETAAADLQASREAGSEGAPEDPAGSPSFAGDTPSFGKA